jgi:hypothetical protein
MATLAQVSSRSRLADLEASEGALAARRSCCPVDARRRRESWRRQKSIESLQAGPDGGRRLIMAILTVRRRFDPAGSTRRLIDDVLTRGIDGVFLECGAEPRGRGAVAGERGAVDPRHH